MIITNFNNAYVKVQSDYIQEVINDPSDYASIEVAVNINCCVEEDNTDTLYEVSVPVDSTQQWRLDLTKMVGLELSLESLKVKSTQTQLVYELLSADIDLDYVMVNCSGEDCTLETFSGHFAPIFKDAIDDWFLAHAISSNVVITFDDDILIVTGLPAGFILDSGASGNLIQMANYNGTLKAFLGSDGLYITPELFSLTALMDGVYRVTIKILKDNKSYTQESNCAFIDIETKCKVASVLQNILQESRTNGEKVSTSIHMLHYALFNGSNCGCNCEELCQVYGQLYSLLNNLDPEITNDCGC